MYLTALPSLSMEGNGDRNGCLLFGFGLPVTFWQPYILFILLLKIKLLPFHLLMGEEEPTSGEKISLWVTHKQTVWLLGAKGCGALSRDATAWTPLWKS